MTSYDDKISEVKVSLNAARGVFKKTQDNLLDLYLNRLRDHYSSLSSLDEKSGFLEGLEILVSKAEKGSEKAVSSRGNASFNGREARRVRKDIGLSQSELARLLGFKHGQTVISRYEREKSTPSNPPTGDLPIKYLLWLKENMT